MGPRAASGREQARAAIAWVALGLFALQTPALLVLALGREVALRDAASLLALGRGVVIGAVVAALATKRLPRAIAAFYWTIVVTASLALLRAYHVPLDAQVGESALAAWADVRPVLSRAAPTLAVTFVVVHALELALLWAAAPAAARIAGALADRRRAAGAAIALALTFVVAPVASSTAEVRVFDLARLVGRGRAEAATRGAGAAVTLPPLVSRRRAPPSVLVILTESVRASDWCKDPGAPCPMSPKVHARAAGRIPLEMRSIASYTAVSFAALTTGRTQEAPKTELQRMPTVFDFVKAARVDGKPLPSLYLSAQARSVFEREDVPGLVDRFASLEDLVGHPVEDEDDVVDQGVDRLLAARCERELGAVAPPYFAMVHLAGTHAPYFVDEAAAPYQPWGRSPAWSKLDKLHNAYLDSIVAQDESVDRCLAAFVAAQRGRPWVVLYTSDHGEAFGEHGAIHHGQSLYDEQLKVPGWVLASEGALDEGQRRALREAGRTTHLDVLPTVLDALGLLGALGMEGPARAFAGRSLLAGAPPPAPVPITNCTAMFRCPVSTWGMLGQARVLTAQPWDAGWRCADLGEEQRLVEGGDRECADLRRRSTAFFPTLPNRAPNSPPP